MKNPPQYRRGMVAPMGAPPSRVERSKQSGGDDFGQDVQRASELVIGDGQGIQETQNVSVHTAA
ncbi:Uncharacterised protein [Bordetella pertussis]|nr:Uncharacterised protein [Bordetella pertussis]